MARVSVATDAFASIANFTQVNNIIGADMGAGGGVCYGVSAGTDASGAVCAAVWSGSGSFTDDQYASLVVGGLQDITTAYNVGVIARASTDNDTARDYYQAIVCGDSAGPNYTTIFSKVVNGTRTQLHSASVAWTNGDRIELECEGTTIRVCKNGTALGGSFTATDSSLTTGKPGIAGAGGSSFLTGDDFIGGNLTADGGDPEGLLIGGKLVGRGLLGGVLIN